MAPDHLPYRLLRDEPSFRRPRGPGGHGGRTKLIALESPSGARRPWPRGSRRAGSLVAPERSSASARPATRPSRRPSSTSWPRRAEEPLDSRSSTPPRRSGSALGYMLGGAAQTRMAGARRSSSPAVRASSSRSCTVHRRTSKAAPRRTPRRGSSAPRPARSRADPGRGVEPGQHARRGPRARASAASTPCTVPGGTAHLHLRDRRIRVLGAQVLEQASIFDERKGHASVVFGLITVAGRVGRARSLGGILADRMAQARVRREEGAEEGRSNPRDGRRHCAREPLRARHRDGDRGTALGDRRRRRHGAPIPSRRSFPPRSPSSS